MNPDCVEVSACCVAGENGFDAAASFEIRNMGPTFVGDSVVVRDENVKVACVCPLLSVCESNANTAVGSALNNCGVYTHNIVRAPDCVGVRTLEHDKIYFPMLTGEYEAHIFGDYSAIPMSDGACRGSSTRHEACPFESRCMSVSCGV